MDKTNLFPTASQAFQPSTLTSFLKILSPYSLICPRGSARLSEGLQAQDRDLEVDLA
jgi:hypothetical protein